MKILEEVKSTFENTEIGTVFSTGEIKDLVYAKYGRNRKSVIPSDYSYNLTNKGKVGSLAEFNIFIQIKPLKVL